MNAFSDEVRKEREARGITLADIAKKTRINIKYLEALEQGAFDVLPQTYVRAFIRSYAESIGIPPAQFLHSYDVIVTQKYSDVQTDEDESLRTALLPTKEKETVIRKEKQMRAALLVVIGIVFLLLIGFYLFDTMGTSFTGEPVTETSFQEVIHEQEHSAIPSPAVDSVATIRAVVPDTLVLRTIALDSVWITIRRDTLPPRSGYMLKGRYRTYRAIYDFRISLSDAGSIRLLLNGKELPPLGRKGERVRNKKITREDLPR